MIPKVTDQFSRGQEMRCELALQISRQLHLHRTYFFPAGAGRIAYSSIITTAIRNVLHVTK